MTLTDLESPGDVQCLSRDYGSLGHELLGHQHLSGLCGNGWRALCRHGGALPVQGIFDRRSLQVLGRMFPDP